MARSSEWPVSRVASLETALIAQHAEVRKRRTASGEARFLRLHVESGAGNSARVPRGVSSSRRCRSQLRLHACRKPFRNPGSAQGSRRQASSHNPQTCSQLRKVNVVSTCVARVVAVPTDYIRFPGRPARKDYTRYKEFRPSPVHVQTGRPDTARHHGRSNGYCSVYTSSGLRAEVRINPFQKSARTAASRMNS